VGVDYFTKWIEAETLASITAKKVQNFVCRNIVFHFGVPHTVVTENGRQLTDRGLHDFYEGLVIRRVTSSIEHPQNNGQAEAPTRSSSTSLKGD